MNILLPSLIKCKRMYKLLALFYNKEKEHENIENMTPFNHALIIFCGFYNMPVPHVRFRRSFGHEKCVGMCFKSGNIELLYPSCYHGNAHSWIGVVFHELAHYYLWSKAEDKAIEFELKMLKRR